MKANILGTEYEIFFKNEQEDTRISNLWGFTDFHTNGSTHKELKNLIDILDKEK